MNKETVFNQDINTGDTNKHPTPLENIRVLEGQLESITKKKLGIEQKLRLLNDKDFDMENVENMEKIEEELDFMTKYHKTLQEQLVCIMNEHNVIIPYKSCT